eukprot:scaffold36118_cov61-Phaeocystis_antarctica.AAC.6
MVEVRVRVRFRLRLRLRVRLRAASVSCRRTRDATPALRFGRVRCSRGDARRLSKARLKRVSSRPAWSLLVGFCLASASLRFETAVAYPPRRAHRRALGAPPGSTPARQARARATAGRGRNRRDACAAPASDRTAQSRRPSRHRPPPHSSVVRAPRPTTPRRASRPACRTPSRSGVSYGRRATLPLAPPSAAPRAEG